MQRTIYFAKYRILNNNVQFELYDKKKIILNYNYMPNFCKSLKDKDLVLIEIELINNEISIKQILDVVDEKILWSNKTYDWSFQNQYLNEIKISKYGKTIGHPKKSLEFHTLKHPICDNDLTKWKKLGINYSESFQTIKNKYENISKSFVVHNRKKDWEFNCNHLSINYIDNNNLLVALKFNKNKSKITTLHFKEKNYNNENIQYDILQCYFMDIYNIIEKFSFEDNYSLVVNTLKQAKRLQSRYFKDNKIDFYYSVYYDFFDMLTALASLKFCYDYINNNDNINNNTLQNLQYEYITFMINCYEDDCDRMNLRKELICLFELNIDND